MALDQNYEEITRLFSWDKFWEMELLDQKVYCSLAFQKFVPTFTAISAACDTDFFTALTLYQFAISHSSMFLKVLEAHFRESH